ncbi:MAG: Holliday junction resolvase RuvX [Candidatus Margulisiibacteriota bacterium]|nr:Holliday junction resolvase RuvX [Candidatus Margulisiibacteriota bacterium]
MRKLGIDYGEKRIGIAVSDPLGIAAQPVEVIENSDQVIERLSDIVSRYEQVDEIIVGLPKTLKGEVGIAAEKVLKFVEELKKVVKIPIVTWDERMTTAAAEKNLIAAGLSRGKRKKVIDKSAAAYILQSYLDVKR